VRSQPKSGKPPYRAKGWGKRIRKDIAVGRGGIPTEVLRKADKNTSLRINDKNCDGLDGKGTQAKGESDQFG